MNKTALRIKMIANNDTGITLSKALNMSNTTLSAKINGKAEFTRNEIADIKERYNLSPKEIDNIFFTL